MGFLVSFGNFVRVSHSLSYNHFVYSEEVATDREASEVSPLTLGYLSVKWFSHIPFKKEGIHSGSPHR